MTTGKILWGAIWRGGAWGLLAGTMIGTAYGALFANGLFAFSMISEADKMTSKDIPSGIVAIVVLALIGAVMGALFGVPTGFVVGVANGLLVGIITRLFFSPLKNARAYRWTLAIVSGLFTATGSFIGFMLIMLSYANRDEANVPVLAVGVLIPAVIGGIAAGLISRLIARWYETRS